MSRLIRCGNGWVNIDHVVTVDEGKSIGLKSLTLADGSTRQVYEQNLHEALADFVPVTGYALLHNPAFKTDTIEVIPIVGLYIARTEESERSLVATLYADGHVHTFDGDFYSLQLPDGRVHNYACGLVKHSEWLNIICREADEEIPEHGSFDEMGTRKTPKVITKKNK